MNLTSFFNHTVPKIRLHRLGIWLVQWCIFVLSAIAAFWLRFDGKTPAANQIHLIWGLTVWIVTKSIVFRLRALDRGWWRFVSVDDVIRIGLGNVAGSAISLGVLGWFGPRGFPRSIYILDLVICFLITAGVRMMIRVIGEARQQRLCGPVLHRALIYGAGQAGVTLLREIRSNRSLRYKACGFIDDDRQKHGLLIQGTKVLGCGENLHQIVRKHHVDTVLIALPSASGSDVARILRTCFDAGVSFRTIPSLGEVIESNGLAGQIRDVAVEDLLGRKAVRLEASPIRAALDGRTVLVTGAAGSIGSELCRQIARFHPAAIVGFDAAESPLFEIDRGMRQMFPQVPIYAEIGSIQHRARLDEVLSQYSPSVVYHAAAYKHVPLMEAHVFEAIENNVFGTYNVAAAAQERGVEDFVMISSDKAVRPTNVMGATKRIAELLLLALQNGRTKYVAVRFGNVLGSNGSVIPIFKKQIAAGGPVTVTHPEMRRFFMTIPEACQLVLQAGAISEGGQICVLDMGEPVKIVDLARNLILLSGLRPDVDIKIEFTGTRPGEKLYEELSTLLEDTVPTEHEKVRIYTGSGLPADGVDAWLGRLREICQTRDRGRLVLALKDIVIDYSPSSDLLKRVIDIRPIGIPAIAAK